MSMMIRFFATTAIVLGLIDTAAAQAPDEKSRSQTMQKFYIGTYTGPESKGIYMAELDTEKGTLSQPELAGETTNPSFIAIHPSKPLLYAVSEVGEVKGQKTGGVSAFSIDEKTRKLTHLNTQPSMGQGPCYVSVDPTGKLALVANYSSGTVAALAINDDGSLAPAAYHDQHTGSGPDPKRQKKAYAHIFLPDPTGKFALSCDLGTDEIWVYKLDAAAGKVTPNDPPKFKVGNGGGPRHFAISPNQKFLYVAQEMGNEITACKWDAEKGTIEVIGSASTLPPNYEQAAKNSTAEIVVHPNGKFVYISNRGHDSIAVFSTDEATGAVKLLSHTPTNGKNPRNFVIDPTGKFLIAANQTGNNLVLFRVDGLTGALTATGSEVKLSAPVCVRFAR